MTGVGWLIEKTWNNCFLKIFLERFLKNALTPKTFLETSLKYFCTRKRIRVVSEIPSARSRGLKIRKTMGYTWGGTLPSFAGLYYDRNVRR